MNVRPPLMRTCKYCGEEYTTQNISTKTQKRNPSERFCSKRCRLLWHKLGLKENHQKNFQKHYTIHKQDLLKPCKCGGSTGVTEEGNWIYVTCFECWERGKLHPTGTSSRVEREVIKEWNELRACEA